MHTQSTMTTHTLTLSHMHTLIRLDVSHTSPPKELEFGREILCERCVQSEIFEFVKVSTGFVQSEGLSQQQQGRTMGPLAVQHKPKLWQLNYFTDKAKLEALGHERPGKWVQLMDKSQENAHMLKN